MQECQPRSRDAEACSQALTSLPSLTSPGDQDTNSPEICCGGGGHHWSVPLFSLPLPEPEIMWSLLARAQAWRVRARISALVDLINKLFNFVVQDMYTPISFRLWVPWQWKETRMTPVWVSRNHIMFEEPFNLRSSAAFPRWSQSPLINYNFSQPVQPGMKPAAFPLVLEAPTLTHTHVILTLQKKIWETAQSVLWPGDS